MRDYKVSEAIQIVILLTLLLSSSLALRLHIVCAYRKRMPPSPEIPRYNFSVTPAYLLSETTMNPRKAWLMVDSPTKILSIS